MDYKVANKNDINGILDLQSRNLITNISEEEKKNGFVTTPFTSDQLEQLIISNGLFVVKDNNTILGYVVAAGWDYFAGRPMFDYMIELFQEIKYKNILITHNNSFQYGPVCIDSQIRGTEAFPQLFSIMKKEMSKKYVIGTTFINKINQRSYNAHTRKVGLEVINEFDFNNNKYYGLAFLVE